MPSPTQEWRLPGTRGDIAVKYYNLGGSSTLLFLTPDSKEPTFSELIKAGARKKFNLISIETKDLAELDPFLYDALNKGLAERSVGLIMVNGFCESALKLAGALSEEPEFLLLLNCAVQSVPLTDEQMALDIPIRIYNSKWNPRLDLEEIEQLAWRLSELHEDGRGNVAVQTLELLWHNYDNFNQQMIIEYNNFINNHYYLPPSLEIQEYRTLFLFVAFFVLYYLCDREDSKQAMQKKIIYPIWGNTGLQSNV